METRLTWAYLRERMQSVGNSKWPRGGHRHRSVGRAILIAGIASVAVMSVLSSAVRAETPRKGGTLRIGHLTTVRHFNPAVQSGNATGVPGAQIFAGLTQMDDKFNAQPYLAKSWEMSSDGLSYTFHLVAGATFHDGKPITSADVAFSFEVVKKNHPFGIAMFAAVDKVETPDPLTAIFKLKNRHPALLAAVSPLLMPILPKHIFDDGQDMKTHPMNAAPIGSGPFKFVEWKKGQYIILERYENFFREGRPYLDRIILTPFKNTTARVLSLETGKIDYNPFSGVRVHDIIRLKKNPKLVVSTRGYEALGPLNYLEFNLRKKPLNDVRVRKAIAYAIDQEFITQKLHFGTTRRLDGPFHHASPFYSRDITTYDLDLDKANALLDEAGYPRGGDGTRFALRLDYASFHPDSQQVVADYLRSQLPKVGIKINIRNSPDFGTWAKRVSNWEYDLSMNAIWNYPDPVIGVHRAYLCNNQKKGVIWSNTEGYCNERVDEILGMAATETNMTKRTALYAEFQKIVTDELPFYWTNEEAYVTIHSVKVKNPPLTVWGAMAPMDEVYLAE